MAPVLSQAGKALVQATQESEIIGNEIGSVGDISGLKSVSAVVEQKLLGQTSTGRIVPNSLKEKLAMEEVMANPAGDQIKKIKMQDPRFPVSDGWVKMQQIIGDKITGEVIIHYLKNNKTGAVVDFKFK